MFTPRKKHLKKKRFFLSEKKTFALFNGSNLKASEITKIKLSLQNAKFYSVPLFLNPPKLGLGYPLVMIVYNKLKDLQQNLPEIIEKIDCLGISINNKWYPIEMFTKENINNLNKKMLAIFLVKNLKK